MQTELKQEVVVRYTGKAVRSTDTTNLPDLIEWCRDYNRYNIYPCSFDKRFAIGFYQIWGGMDWGDGDNGNESMASATLHFLMVLELANLKAEKDLPISLLDPPFRRPDWKELLRRLSRAQQHILYASQLIGTAGTVQTSRSRRYKPAVLELDLTTAIHILLFGIRPEKRSQAIHDATTNMTQKL
jgi:hypothetical protein